MRSLYAWATGFFQPAKTEPEEKILRLCEADYNLSASFIRKKCTIIDGENSLYTYLQTRRYRTDRYTKVIFNCFDFTRSHDSNRLLPLVSPEFIFIQAEFTIQQIENLLSQDFDLTRCSYRVREPIFLDHYIQLYKSCATNNVQNRLHGVPVDLSDCDLRGCPDDFLVSCTPHSTSNTDISEAQLYCLLSYKEKEKLKSFNLSGLLFSNVNISQMIKNYNHMLSFNVASLYDLSGAIYLGNSSIQDAIMDLDTLLYFSHALKFQPWFKVENLIFKLRFEDGLLHHDVEVNVDNLILKLQGGSLELPGNSSRNATPRLSIKNAFFNTLEKILFKGDAFPENLSFNQMKNGEKLLWVICFAVENPQSPITKYFWQTLGYKPDLREHAVKAFCPS